ncbi:MAG TPA: hypothetical protein VH583_10110 [Vicinamibacterales bacterium]|jgi:hypothetical protein
MRTSVGTLAAITVLAVSTVARAQPAPKRCIAVATPVVQGVPGSAADAAAGVRDLVVSYLNAPSVKVVALEAKLLSQAADEARAKDCEPLLVISVTRKAGNGGFGKALGQAAGSSAWYVPGGGTVASAAARAAATGGLQVASSLAASTRAKDEVRLEYRLQTTGGQTQFGPNTERQSAKVDGEDLLTPVVMRAAEAILTRKGTE